MISRRPKRDDSSSPPLSPSSPSPFTPLTSPPSISLPSVSLNSVLHVPRNKGDTGRKIFKLFFKVVTFLVVVLIPGMIYEEVTKDWDPCKTKSLLTSANHQTSLTSSTHLPLLLHLQSRTYPLPLGSTEQLLQKTWLNVYPGIEVLFEDVTSLTKIIEDNRDQYIHVIWTDESCAKLVSEVGDFSKVYNNLSSNIEKIDSCRYIFLSEFGGVYHDSDFEVVSDFWDVLPPDGVGLVESPYRYNEVVQNSLMSSVVGHPFWEGVLVEIGRRSSMNIKKPFGMGVLQTTGPTMLSDTMQTYQSTTPPTSSQTFGPVTILSCALFHRVPRGIYDTTFGNIVAREYLTRLVPMKGCGNFRGEGDCEVTRHWGRASWTKKGEE
ncbi:hypothetical protein TL16_g01920 [Triparma laevis f. inornata]|uniref:Uncharacterized protein n=1 Tax=Triparma laevis f. inornata TaxID=1714386 RepID=A0A9W7DVA1_9STRA|nr:hypothetical protein TL16_g01920 [Triparma laevis f. inornata]